MFSKCKCCHVRMQFSPEYMTYIQHVSNSMFSVLFGSVTVHTALMREGGYTQRSLWKRLPQLTLVTSHYYYLIAWSLAKKTILRLWLEWMERRTESEGKEWASRFPGGVKTWIKRERRWSMQEWEASWSPGQICVSFCETSYFFNVKYGRSDVHSD